MSNIIDDSLQVMGWNSNTFMDILKVELKSTCISLYDWVKNSDWNPVQKWISQIYVRHNGTQNTVLNIRWALAEIKGYGGCTNSQHAVAWHKCNIDAKKLKFDST